MDIPLILKDILLVGNLDDLENHVILIKLLKKFRLLQTILL